MNISKLANFPEIRLEQSQGVHRLYFNDNSELYERFELEHMMYGASMLMQIIRQYLFDLDYQVKELEPKITEENNEHI